MTINPVHRHDLPQARGEVLLTDAGLETMLVFDQGVRESLSAIESYIRADLVTEAANLAELAALLEIPVDRLSATVAAYNEAAVAGTDREYGRASFARTLDRAPFYAVEVGPAVHHTMGGIEIDVDARVIGEGGAPVPGLFAAGECTGGVHGANRLGGNALADIITFGRIAGRNAAAAAR